MSEGNAMRLVRSDAEVKSPGEYLEAGRRHLKAGEPAAAAAALRAALGEEGAARVGQLLTS